MKQEFMDDLSSVAKVEPVGIHLHPTLASSHSKGPWTHPGLETKLSLELWGHPGEDGAG